MIDTVTFTSRLEADLVRITEELKAIANYNEITDDWEAIPDTTEADEADINVEADAVEGWNERRATVSALEVEYRDIKRALSKLRNNTFGLCEVCQTPIAVDRLEFRPTARTCQDHLNDEASLGLN